MDRVTIVLRVYFEQGKWIGVFERIEEEMLCVHKIYFDHEPKDYEVYAYVLHHELIFSKTNAVPFVKQKAIKSAKRRIREATLEVHKCGISTKSQISLQLELQQRKDSRKQSRKVQKQQEKEAAFKQRQAKRKSKHRGR